MKVSELTGALLDYWVARSEGAEPVDDYGRPCLKWPGKCALMDGRNTPGYISLPDYSTSWAQGGPIIERERIKLMPVQPSGATWYGIITRGASVAESQVWRGQAETPLVAAMRAYVASKFGDEVPTEEAA